MHGLGPGEILAASTHNPISSSPVEEVRKINRIEEQKVKRMNLNVPVEIHHSFKSVTAAAGQNMTDVLLEFIEDYIRRHSPEEKKPKRRRS